MLHPAAPRGPVPVGAVMWWLGGRAPLISHRVSAILAYSGFPSTFLDLYVTPEYSLPPALPLHMDLGFTKSNKPRVVSGSDLFQTRPCHVTEPGSLTQDLAERRVDFVQSFELRRKGQHTLSGVVAVDHGLSYFIALANRIKQVI